MPRALRLPLILLAIVVFVVLSLGLGRMLTASSGEQGAIGDLVTTQARGDLPAVLRMIDGCAARAACRRRQEENVRRLRRRAVIKILNLEPATRFSLGALRGVTRVAWAPEGGTPVVQCVDVDRTGSVVSGFDVKLTALSAPIGRTASCPKR